MKNLAIALFLVVTGCSGKSDSSATATKTTETEPSNAPAKTEPAKVETKAEPKAPAKTEPAKPAADKDEVSDADRKLVGEVGEATKIDWKTPTGDTVTVQVKQRVEQKMYVTDLLENGKVIHTIQSGVEKGDIHMEARSAVKAIPQGVLVVVKSLKVTGKPSDSYQARVLVWSATQKKLGIERTINFSDEYDPSEDKVDD